jgi:hypothetical protein
MDFTKMKAVVFKRQHPKGEDTTYRMAEEISYFICDKRTHI